MSNLFLTLVIAFVIIVIAIACMAIGWLIKGKTKIDQRSCSSTQTKNQECGSTTLCSLSKTPKNKS